MFVNIAKFWKIEIFEINFVLDWEEKIKMKYTNNIFNNQAGVGFRYFIHDQDISAYISLFDLFGL